MQLIFEFFSILYEAQRTEAIQSEIKNDVNKQQGSASSFSAQKN